VPVLGPQEVFAAAAPSLAFIETPLGTGSGVVFAPGRVVTNYHVVWPEETVRVVFPDGSEIADAAVVAVDQMLDLAVVDVSALGDAPPPLAFGSVADAPIGSELFLIGYPGESETFPQPTLTRGLLSRVRSATGFGVTYLQTDAVIAGGQSGGALLSDRGEVVGISTFSFEGFALALSGSDVADRVGRMLDGEDTDGLEYRSLPSGGGAREQTVEIANFLADATFLIEAVRGTTFTVEARTTADAILGVIAADGVVEVIADDTAGPGSETITFTMDLPLPYLLVVSALTYEPAVIDLESDATLVPWVDPDDGLLLQPGDERTGNFDYPGDNDWYEIDLAAGQSVTVLVRSILAAPELVIDLAENELEPLAFDAGSGGGLFGTDSRIEFTAPETRRYLLGVQDTSIIGPGGYLLTVDD
jgi:hypothetical protein